MYRPDYDFLSPNSMFFLELFESILINNYNYQNPEVAINSLNIYNKENNLNFYCLFNNFRFSIYPLIFLKIQI